MICSRCGEHFKVKEVTDILKLLNNVDYDDIPERVCYNCALDYIHERTVTLFEGCEDDDDQSQQ